MTNKYSSLNKKKNIEPYPMILKPIYKDYLWGGDKLKSKYNKDAEISPLAESWECSTHPNGLSIIANGPYEGYSLKEVLSLHPEWIGKKVPPNGDLPILFKLIDAKKDLSIQVHPDDDYALKNEDDNGKTEMWYVLEADKGSELIYGFINDVTKDVVRKAIDQNELLKYLNRVPIKAGDVFFIDPGTVHAIGAGAVIAEVQQSSNITYRVFDYGRTDRNGKSRELHVDKALDIMNLNAAEIDKPKIRVLKYEKNSAREIISRCSYFQVERLLINGNKRFNIPNNTFKLIYCIAGKGELIYKNHKLSFEKGDSIFLVGSIKSFELNCHCELLVCKI